MKNKYIAPTVIVQEIGPTLMFNGLVESGGQGNGRPAEAKGGYMDFSEYDEPESDTDEIYW